MGQDTRMLVRAGIRQHTKSLLCIALLVFLVVLSGCLALALWSNARAHLEAELSRTGFGDLTFWVSGTKDEIDALSDAVGQDLSAPDVQRIVLSEYETNGHASDSEGQLIPSIPDGQRYRIFRDDLGGYREEDAEVTPGSVLVSPSLASMFDVQIGDEIVFPIARDGRDVTLRVMGYFEDPAMGSSMIGMKSFLIAPEDHEEICRLAGESDFHALARPGAMLHIAAPEGTTAAELTAQLHQVGNLAAHTEFVHSKEILLGFMMTLENVFIGLFAAFVLVLAAVALIVLGHSIRGTVERDAENIGVLRAMGFPLRRLRGTQLLQYLPALAAGMLLGILAAGLLLPPLTRLMVETTGFLVPSVLPALPCALFAVAVGAILVLFVWCSTRPMAAVTPIAVLRGAALPEASSIRPRIRRRVLVLSLALRNVCSRPRR